MAKRFARIAAASMLAVAFMIPSMAFAAPAASPAALAVTKPSQWQPFAIWSGRAVRPGKTGLQYQLTYSPSKNELQLIVVNPTDEDIKVTTPNGQKTDFTAWQNGKLVWRASTGKSYPMVVTTETIKANEGKIYKETLPNLPSGTYQIQAYYLGETTRNPVAVTTAQVVAPKTTDPLKYSVEFLGAGWFNSSPRLRVTIKNTSDKDVKLPYQWGYQVLVKTPGASEYIGTVGIGESIGTIAAGATRYVFVNLDGLEPGVYQADIRSNIGSARSWTYRVVAQTWFYVE